MKSPYILPHLLLMLIFSAGLDNGAKIPEHWCHRMIGLNKCESQKCSEECSKEANGSGDCKGGATCLCTYYCENPPLY
ncbi:hypothetical protein PIB30_048530 [Stylosanthes scabra]|uniref:Defensin-like protein n=1 Tax=Stylosanthes scabra TaxID=79078 RepID=A0ABU6ZFT5_9FABA|nr:hypothetical protein [Stylosanthes scabra]